MKTLVVGDMHQKQHLILPMIDAGLRALGVERVVMLGDYCDDWNMPCPETDRTLLLEGLEALDAWVAEARAHGIACDVLLGNHDMQYLLGDRGPGTNMGCLEEVRALLSRMEPRIAAHVDGWLLTHAGLTGVYVREVLELDVGSEPTDAWMAESLASLLNEMLATGTYYNLKRLSTCGPGRGGCDIPGPLWAATEELLFDPMPGVDQIVGHTPLRTCAEIGRGYGLRERIIGCDTFSTNTRFQPLGDGSMLLLDDGDRSVRFLDPVEIDCEPWGW